jgi:ubiquitin carboxyl-terminal hydrolase L3
MILLIGLSAEGPLTKFLEQCRAKSPSERAQLLEDDCAIADVHADQAQSGQSKVELPFFPNFSFYIWKLT